MFAEGADEVLRIVVTQLRRDIFDGHIGFREPFLRHTEAVSRQIFAE